MTNDVQSLIDRELGIYSRLNYDNVLKRLIVHPDESFYGLQSSGPEQWNYDSDPPIFACRFCEAPGYEHILALANEDGKVAIQDTTNTKTARLLESFQCHNNAVFDLAWMPGQLSFVTVSGDHTACLWECGAGGARRLHTFAGHSRSVKTAAFRPGGGGVFATGARDGHVLVWDARAAPPAAALRPDNRLASCHASAAPATPPSRHKRRPPPRAISITGLVFQDEHTLLSCGECDGNIKAWDLRKNYSAYTREPLPRHAIPYPGAGARRGYSCLLVDAARARLYASCMDHAIYCFNVRGAASRPERRYLGHENSTFYIKAALSPDGRYLVSGSSDKRAYVWNVRRAAPVLRLDAHRAEVTCAAWGAALVTCGDDARHHLWRLGPERPDPDVAWAGRAGPAPRAAPPPLWPRPEPAPRRGKRCLAPLMDAAEGAKRPRAEREPAPAPPAARAPPPTRDLPDWVRDGAAPHLRLMSPPKKRPDTTDWLTRLARDKRARLGDAPPAPAAPAAPAAPPRRASLERAASLERTPKAKRGPTILKYFTIQEK